MTNNFLLCLDKLKKLKPSEFDEVLAHYGFSIVHSARNASQTQQAIDFLKYVELQDGFKRLQAILKSYDIDVPTDESLLLLCQYVKTLCIDGLLNNDFHQKFFLELQKEWVQKEIAPPWNRLSKEKDRLLSPKTQINEIFEQTYQSLLILGEAGAGKTMTLLGLAQHLLTKAESDIYQPIPVIFNLSSWSQTHQTLRQWLIEELHCSYHIPNEICARWLKNGRILPLLDGLDEVSLIHQAQCVSCINEFAADYGLTGLVVCCRIKEYRALLQPLSLKGAIVLHPLSAKQVDEHLICLGETMAGLRTLLSIDEVLRELSKSPLMLNMMCQIYQGISAESVTQSAVQDIERRREQLFELYINKRLQDKIQSKNMLYPQQALLEKIGWLAGRLYEKQQPKLMLENLQPDWVEKPWLFGLIFGAFSGLFFGIFTGGFLGLFIDLYLGLLFFICIGFLYGVVGGLYFSFFGQSHKIKIKDHLRWSWQKFKQQSWKTFLIWLLFYALLWIFNLLDEETINFIMVCILFFFLIKNGMENTIDNKIRVNQGIHTSFINATKFFLIGVFTTIIIFLSMKLTIGFEELSFGLLFAVSIPVGFGFFGGVAVLQHYALRLTLIIENRITWHYQKFLDYAALLIFLHKMGGSYTFIHPLFLKYLAKHYDPLQRKNSQIDK